MEKIKTLSDAINWAKEGGVALGHFNISDSTQLNGIAKAAWDARVPVIVGVSEGERDFLGGNKVVPMVRAAREEFGIPIFANADHVHDVEGCKRAIDWGFDSVIFDGSKLPMEENVAMARKVVAYANESGREVIVEGEVGYIGTSSKLLDDIPEDVLTDALPSSADVKKYVDETGVTAVAPAVGNLHGMLKGRANPSLRIDLIREISGAVGIPMVLHGGSGLSNEDFKEAILAGMRIVHINTEIRLAYRKGIEEALADNKEEIAPYRYLGRGRDVLSEVVKKRLLLFSAKA